ncbi:hypothetical protein GCM10027403_16290 [Arthrobacter tecti]
MPIADQSGGSEAESQRSTFLTFHRQLPQPLRGFYIAFMVAFACTWLTILFSAVLQNGVLLTAALWLAGALGLCGFLVGLFIITNFRGSLPVMVKAMKSYRPMGIDYSRSFIATPGYLRVVAVAFMVIGVFFIQVPFNPAFQELSP